MDTPSSVNAAVFMKRSFEEMMAGTGVKAKVPSKKQFATRLSFDLDDSDLPNQSSNLISRQLYQEKEKEVRDQKLALANANARIIELETSVQKLNSSAKKWKIEHEKEVENLKNKHSSESMVIESMKNQTRILSNKKEEAEELYSVLKKSVEKSKAVDQKHIATLQREKEKLEAANLELRYDTKKQISELDNTVISLQRELSKKTSDLDDALEQLDEALKKNGFLCNENEKLSMNELRAEKAEAKLKEMERILSSRQDDIQLASTLKPQLSLLPEIKKENIKLKEDILFSKSMQDNNLLLKDEIENLKQKLARSEERCKNFAELQVDYEELQSKLKQWEVTKRDGITVVMTPTEMKQRINDLQNTNLMLLEKEGELESRVSSLELKLKDSTDEHEKDAKELAKIKITSAHQADLIKRLNRKVLLFSKEKDGLKNILDSYENDITMNVQGKSAERIGHLEDIVKDCHAHITALEEELDAKSSNLCEVKARASLLSCELDRSQDRLQIPQTSDADAKIIKDLRDQMAELTKRLEETTLQKEILEDRFELRHLQGDYDPTKTKVVHLRMNPAAVAQKHRASELERLTKENSELRERVKVLKEAGADAQDVTMQVEKQLSEPDTSKELAEAKEKLNSWNLKYQRLTEAFKKKSNELRKAVFSLFGFRLDMPSDNHYQLLNRYADSQDDYFLFQGDPETDCLKLLETPNLGSWEETINTCLTQYDSIPMFLSSVTVELFQRQTVI